MTTNDKVTLTAAALAALVVFGVFTGWNTFADNARAKAAAEARMDADYLACMSAKLGALKISDLDPRVKKLFIRQCSARV